ncbi:hypothetical protein B0I35DRAFT_501362 [Stachybotrys elegans]|uniref:Clr5 domain-containing protein n=1 Tax=Stachybotrys elegans TaxID=80388 RepID=A0A8K0WTJ8_9HYPO|nr:hypothetical protein B0I35DRAFT_501362 [Stachybotrys elegans]
MVGSASYRNEEIKWLLDQLVEGEEAKAIIDGFKRNFKRSLTKNQLRYIKNKYGRAPEFKYDNPLRVPPPPVLSDHICACSPLVNAQPRNPNRKRARQKRKAIASTENPEADASASREQTDAAFGSDIVSGDPALTSRRPEGKSRDARVDTSEGLSSGRPSYDSLADDSARMSSVKYEEDDEDDIRNAAAYSGQLQNLQGTDAALVEAPVNLFEPSARTNWALQDGLGTSFVPQPPGLYQLPSPQGELDHSTLSHILAQQQGGWDALPPDAMNAGWEWYEHPVINNHYHDAVYLDNPQNEWYKAQESFIPYPDTMPPEYINYGHSLPADSIPFPESAPRDDETGNPRPYQLPPSQDMGMATARDAISSSSYATPFVDPYAYYLRQKASTGEMHWPPCAFPGLIYDASDGAYPDAQFAAEAWESAYHHCAGMTHPPYPIGNVNASCYGDDSAFIASLPSPPAT